MGLYTCHSHPTTGCLYPQPSPVILGGLYHHPFAPHTAPTHTPAFPTLPHHACPPLAGWVHFLPPYHSPATSSTTPRTFIALPTHLFPLLALLACIAPPLSLSFMDLRTSLARGLRFAPCLTTPREYQPHSLRWTSRNSTREPFTCAALPRIFCPQTVRPGCSTTPPGHADYHAPDTTRGSRLL